ncbi:MAG: phosphohydrolase, partial [Anaerovorax sp.]
MRTFDLIDELDVILIIRDTLNSVDPRLVGHGGRAAYIILSLLRAENRLPESEIQELCLVGLMHDVGAYKTEAIDQLLIFETGEYWPHSIYGSLFLKYLSPLGKYADAVLYHHVPYAQLSDGLPYL